MFRNHSQAVLFLLCMLTIGCSNSTPDLKKTLIVHAHDCVYDFIDHDGNISESVDNLDDFEAVLMKDEIKNLITDDRVIVRFAGMKTPDGLNMPEELVPVMAKLAGAGVMQQDFDYTND